MLQIFRPLVYLAIAVVVLMTNSRGQAGETLGLQKEKPTSGLFVKTDKGYMVPYKTKIPGTNATYEMVPIPGGKFKMGSPANEAGRKPDEGPQYEVEIEPFWMGKYEVTWSEYKPYMALYGIFKKFSIEKVRVVNKETEFDAITAPTKLYDPSHTFEKGDDPRQPAVTMTQYAAKQYTKWLSRVSDRFYRLPTEAEWEYACRAGKDTAYFFGDDPAKLGDYAWYAKNSDEKPQHVGKKKPSPWGLYDIHGNAAEWVLDAYTADGYKQFAGKPVTSQDALKWPTKPYPLSVRGGSWEFEAAECRSASRLASHDVDWKAEDPNLPLSPWWFTSDPARGVGFRLIRPLTKPDRKTQETFWKARIEFVIQDVKDRLEEGRGVLGIVDPELPKVIDGLKD